MYIGKHQRKKEHRSVTAVLTAAALIVLSAILVVKLYHLFSPISTVSDPVSSVNAEIPPAVDQSYSDKADIYSQIDKTEDDIEPIEEDNGSTIFTLSFAGDCTLGTDHSVYGGPGTFIDTVGSNYSYPFQNAAEYFKNDDFTIVNLEGALTEYRVPAEKTYRFRGPKEYTAILTQGGVESVSLANNHTSDYGAQGYSDTIQALKDAGIDYCENKGSFIYTTEGGLKIGVYGGFFVYEIDLSKPIDDLRAQGADIVICAFHWGDEGSYTPNDRQTMLAHRAIDAGADFVYGTHPHVLQPIERYNGGVICYSLGNFCFGGNRNPADKDTAIIQQKVIRDSDGTLSLGETDIIPFSLSGTALYNDFCPTPMMENTDEYDRVFSKLDGSFRPAAAKIDGGEENIH